MSSVIEPSSIVLIIGAICIFLFIMHGLWFSNKPQNRKLKQNNQHDMELSKSSNVGKVRIVTPDPAGADEVKNNKSQGKRADAPKAVRISENYGDDYNAIQASVGVNPKLNRGLANGAMGNGSMGNGEQDPNYGSQMQAVSSAYASQMRSNANNLGAATAQDTPWLKLYEIVIVSRDNQFLGEDIDALCQEYGFLPGYIKNTNKIYSVYEDAQNKVNEVFRICSMEPPYSFPEDMRGFKTSAIVLYMPLPPKGKGNAYFRALRMASEIFANRLNGQLQDQSHNLITTEMLNSMSANLELYDNQG